MKLICYSNEKGKDLASLCIGKIDGVRINSCHPKWYKSCKKTRRCSRFFSEGNYYHRKEVAKLLKISVSKLSDKKLDEKTKEFEKKGFKYCKKIKVTIE